jgi:hypothetical protein
MVYWAGNINGKLDALSRCTEYDPRKVRTPDIDEHQLINTVLKPEHFGVHEPKYDVGRPPVILASRLQAMTEIKFNKKYLEWIVLACSDNLVHQLEIDRTRDGDGVLNALMTMWSYTLKVDYGSQIIKISKLKL